MLQNAEGEVGRDSALKLLSNKTLESRNGRPCRKILQSTGWSTLIYTVRGENSTEYICEYAGCQPPQTLRTNFFRCQSHYRTPQSAIIENFMDIIHDGTVECAALYFIRLISFQGHGVRKAQLRSHIFYTFFCTRSFQRIWERLSILHPSCAHLVKLHGTRWRTSSTRTDTNEVAGYPFNYHRSGSADR
jgi:hypothetical protein